MRKHYRTIIENLRQDSIAHAQRIRQARAEIDALRLQVATLEGMVGGLAERVVKLESMVQYDDTPAWYEPYVGLLREAQENENREKEK